MLPVYKTIAQDVLATVNDVELQILREMLQKLVKNLEAVVGDKNSPIYIEFHKYLVVTHLLLLKGECIRNNLHNVNAKLCTSLLRYCKDIRADNSVTIAGIKVEHVETAGGTEQGELVACGGHCWWW